MSQVLVSESNLTGIANAIRAKNGSSDTYTPAEMATAIGNIPTGSATLITKSVTANGTYAASSDNADGYSSVSVNVPGASTLVAPFKVATGTITIATATASPTLTVDPTQVNLATDTVLHFYIIMDETEWSTYEGDSTYDNRVAGVHHTYAKRYFVNDANEISITLQFKAANANYHTKSSSGNISVDTENNTVTVSTYSNTKFLAGAKYNWIIVAAQPRAT